MKEKLSKIMDVLEKMPEIDESLQKVISTNIDNDVIFSRVIGQIGTNKITISYTFDII